MDQKQVETDCCIQATRPSELCTRCLNEYHFIQDEIQGRIMEQTRPEPPTPQGGTKHDTGKPPMELLNHGALVHIANVFGHGATKYGRYNYKKGIAFSRLIGAAYRHLGAFNSGEDLDPESGLPHLAHLGCCVLMLLEQLENKELDDRFKNSLSKAQK